MIGVLLLVLAASLIDTHAPAQQRSNSPHATAGTTPSPQARLDAILRQNGAVLLPEAAGVPIGTRPRVGIVHVHPNGSGNRRSVWVLQADPLSAPFAWIGATLNILSPSNQGVRTARVVARRRFRATSDAWTGGAGVSAWAYLTDLSPDAIAPEEPSYAFAAPLQAREAVPSPATIRTALRPWYRMALDSVLKEVIREHGKDGARGRSRAEIQASVLGPSTTASLAEIPILMLRGPSGPRHIALATLPDPALACDNTVLLVVDRQGRIVQRVGGNYEINGVIDVGIDGLDELLLNRQLATWQGDSLQIPEPNGAVCDPT